MTSETEHTSQLLLWMIEHAPGLVLLVTTAFGMVYWWMRKIFATSDKMQECKTELLGALDNHEERERRESREFRDDVKIEMADLRSDTSLVRRDLGELKNMLINWNRTHPHGKPTHE